MAFLREIGLRSLLAIAILLGIFLLANAANAAPLGTWVESHMTGCDAGVSVGDDGVSRFEIALTLRVAAGALHDTNVFGLRAASIDAVEVKSEEGTPAASSFEVLADRVHVVYDGKGLKRGVYVVRLRGSVKL